MRRTCDCATQSIIGHELLLSTMVRAALATPHCVDAGTRMDALFGALQIDSWQWHASSCNDRPCLIPTSVRPQAHKAALSVLAGRSCFSVRPTGPFLRPDLPCNAAPSTAAVKIGRSPPRTAGHHGLYGRGKGGAPT